MRAEDAVEIVRASLALAFPGASAEGLSRAAELVVRWGAEGVAEHLDQALTRRMLLDLLVVSGAPAPELADRQSPSRGPTAWWRTWSRPEEGPELPFRPPGSEPPPDPDQPPGEPRRRREPPF